MVKGQGQYYGVLVNLETRQPITLLPSRMQEALGEVFEPWGVEPTFRRLTIVFYCALPKPIAESLSTRGSWQMNHGLMKVEA